MKTDIEKAWMGIISAFILSGTFYLSWHIINTDQMTREQATVTHLILGYVFGLSNIVVGYYFMSSKGSREKTKIINDIMSKNHEASVRRSIESADEFADSVKDLKIGTRYEEH